MNICAHGIMFHHFYDEVKHPRGQGAISVDQFRNMILWLQENFTIIAAREWYDKAEQNKLKEKDICFTFDDNLLCQFEIALPILEEFDIKAFWFVYSSPFVGVKEKLEIYRYYRSVKYTDINDFYTEFNQIISTSEFNHKVKDKLKRFDASKFLASFPFYTLEDKIFRYTRDYILGRESYYNIMDEMINQSGLNVNEISSALWNTPSNIKYLSNAGHIVGLHSHTHPTELKILPVSQQKEEYENNISIVSSITGSKVVAMSHPCNSYTEATLNILKKIGIRLGFRSNMDTGYISPLEKPRQDHSIIINKIGAK